MLRPPDGWTVPCEVVRVIDGDTVRVRVTKEINVRLLECYAPELRQPGGVQSREYLREMLDGREVTLHIPGDESVAHLFTFSRVLGRLFAGDHDVSEGLVAAGCATREKHDPA